MSDPAKSPDEIPADPAPGAEPLPAPDATPAAELAPNANPPATEALPLEVMPGAAPTAPDGTSQALVVTGTPGAPPSPPPPPPTPIDYAMPSSKTWIPSPALIRNFGCIFKMLLGFTVMLCVGYFMLMALNPKARQWALQGSQKGADGQPLPGSHGPTPFKFVNQMLALPAQALAKTDDVVKANNARAGVVDGLVAEEEGKLKGDTARRAVVNPFAAGGTSAPATKESPAGGQAGATTAVPDASADERAALAARMMELAEKGAANANRPKADAVRPTAIAVRTGEVLPPVTLPGGVVIQSASPEGAPAASRTFFYWVVNASISGVTSGPPARLLVGGRLAYEGNEIYIPLGIVFERLDPAAKVLYFRDQTGAVVTRSY